MKIGFHNLREIEKTLKFYKMKKFVSLTTTKCLNVKETLMDSKSKTENKIDIIKIELE